MPGTHHYISISVIFAFTLLTACMAPGRDKANTPIALPKVNSMSQEEVEKTTAMAGRVYAKNPADKRKAMYFSALLQITGKTDQSLAVMRRLAITHPKDRQVLASYGKALAASGQHFLALETIRRAQTPEYPDWKLLSSEAAILDQLNQKDQARILYKKALDLRPNEPMLLSNIGMSYLFSGELNQAETWLRKAASQPNADSRVRQNLALVLGLKGHFQEASEIISSELPPDKAKANIAFLRNMLAQQNPWKTLEKEGKKTIKK